MQVKILMWALCNTHSDFQWKDCYTRMLRMALNLTCQHYPTNEELYQELPKVTEKT